MTNPLILDHNSLVYAWEAGGEALLNRFADYAKAAGFELIVTDVVAYEISNGKLRLELQNWLVSNSVAQVSTAEYAALTEYQYNIDHGLPTGNYDPTNAGDRSMSEFAQTTKDAGESPRIFSDDKWFSNSQLLKPYTLSQQVGIGTADMLNHAALSGAITPEEFADFHAAYQNTVNPFIKNGGAYIASKISIIVCVTPSEDF